MSAMTAAHRADAESIRVGGLEALTTIDYPGELAAVVFCQGCPWRCRYCHNGGLLDAKAGSRFDWPEILQFLARRQGLLDAVVFSGGEPTLQRSLPRAMQDVKALGFKVGLHTAGCYPQRLDASLPFVDWVGLDIKTVPEDYESLTGVHGSGQAAWQSLEILAKSRVPFEVRTTVHPELLPRSELQSLVGRLRRHGVPDVTLQPCNTDIVLDESLVSSSRSPGLQRTPLKTGARSLPAWV